MEETDKIWDYLIKLPRLLNEYGTYSYPLLGVLLAAGLLICGIHFYRRKKSSEGLNGAFVLFGAALCFLSLAGFFLKWAGSVQAERARQQFIADHRAPAGEHWLLVFDFSLPPSLDQERRDLYLARMKHMVEAMYEVLHEDLPMEFKPPRVVRIPTAESPWREGIGQDNFDKVIRELNAFEIMWGTVHAEGTQAKAFLGISKQLAQDLDTVIPLRDFSFEEDPRREHQFGDGYYRLLGLVTLGMALDTYRQAQEATGDERKALFIKAVEQMNTARENVINRRDDPILKRNVYSPQVDALIETAMVEAG